MIRIERIIFIIVLWVNFSFGQNHQINFEKISLDQGLSHSIVLHILQDSKGYLWISTGNGINKYDGISFYSYRPNLRDPYSISSNYAEIIFEDSKGRLWFGHRFSGLDLFDRNIEKFTHFRNKADNPYSLSSDNVNAITEDKDGFLWIGTGNAGLNKFDPASGKCTRLTSDTQNKNTISSNDIRHLWMDKNERLWICTTNGLDCLDFQTQLFKHYQNNPNDPNSLSSNLVNHIFQDKEKSLWISTNNGLNKLDQHSGKFTRYFDSKGADKTPANDIKNVCEDFTGLLWICTSDGLISHNKTQGVQRYQNDIYLPTSISSNELDMAIIDKFDILWIGTHKGGLNKVDLRKKPFLSYKNNPSSTNSLNTNNVFYAYEDKNSILWVGTWDGGLNRIDRNSNIISHFPRNVGTPKGLADALGIAAILEDDQDNLWVIPWVYGIYKYRPATGFQHLMPNNTDGFESWACRSAVKDFAGNIWLASYDAGLVKYTQSSGKFKTFRNDPNNNKSLPENMLWTVAVAQDNKIWLGSETQGLFEFDPNQEIITKSFKHNEKDSNSLNNNSVRAIYDDKAGFLWIGTAGGGLEKLNKENGVFKHFTENDGLSNNIVYAIQSDNNNNLWIATDRGLSRLNISTDKFTNYYKSDGLPSSEFSPVNASKSDKGELFFATVDGLLSFFPEQIKDNPHLPKTVITNLIVDGKSVQIGKEFNGQIILKESLEATPEIRLNHANNNFAIEFAALHFSIPGKNMYAYQLEGFDDELRLSGVKNPMANYSNLPSGNYIFKVKSANCDGVWNEDYTILKIRIAPPFYKTWWFVVSAILAFVLFIIIFIRLRENSLKKEKNNLEEQVQKRTSQLEKQKEELLKQNEEILRREKIERDFNWYNGGLAKFSSLLSKNKSDFHVLTKEIINNLTLYMNATQGAIYILECDATNQSFLMLTAGYAIDEKKERKVFFYEREGLVGACFTRKQTLVIENIPADYIKISSGFGEALPKNILLCPMKLDEIMLGVIELASFDKFEEIQVKFIEKLAENITSVIYTLRIQEQTQSLLKQSQEQAILLKGHDEQLRQNLEKLERTQQEMFHMKTEESIKNRKIVSDLEMYQKSILNILNKFPGKIFLKDQDGRFILANQAVLDFMKVQFGDIIGKSDFDLFNEKLATQFRNEEIEIIESGGRTYTENEYTSDGKKTYRTTKIPFYIDYLAQTGLLGFQIEITEMIGLEKELEENKKMLELAYEKLREVEKKIT